MSLYRVDFFDRSLNNTHHDVIDALTIDEDYLAPENSEFSINYTNAVKASDFVYISGAFNFLGVVTSVTDSNYLTKISVKPFISMFDANILFDTDLQGQSSTKSLESVLESTIKKYWITSGDSSENLPILQTNCFSSTLNWGFNLKSDTENQHYCIINFYSVLIARSLTKYGITITPRINFQTKKIVLNIGAISEIQSVQADLPGIEIRSFDINRDTQTINKIFVYNTENYSSVRTYFLHTDGSYDRTDSNRVTPVVFDVKAVTPSQDLTFEKLADDEASNTFGNIDWNSLIELEVDLNNSAVNPLEYRIGTPSNIWHYGSVYNTILTCKTCSEKNIVLSYGAVRTTLTKKQILTKSKFS